ncbi:MAG: vitamin K epoxide reductase family protein [Vicinamibacterales bacterium]
MTRTRVLLLLFAGVALVASLLALNVHYQLLADTGYTSFCDVNETVNCEAVYQSEYGSIRGVPVAAGGVIWAAAVLLLAAWGMRRPASDDAKQVGEYVFVLGVIGLAVVLYLGYTSYFVLHKVCLLCAATYVGVFGVFFVSAGVTSMPLVSLPGRFLRDVRSLFAAPASLVLAVLWLAGSASLVAFFPREGDPVAAAPAPASPAAAAPAASAAAAPEATPAPAEASQAAPAASPVPGLKVLTPAQRADFQRWYAAQPVTPVVVPTDGAKVVILKFNDYQCPPCRQTFMNYKPILKAYAASHPGQVKFITRDFPLDPECNSGGGHQAGCEAAAAVRMARLKGRADAMEDWLFDNQPAMNPDLVRQGVRSVAGVMDFNERYSSVLEQVKADIKAGQALGVNRTPTFFINGRKLEGGLDPEYFDAAIAFELARATP